MRKFLLGMIFGQNRFAWWVRAWVNLIEAVIEIVTFTVISPAFDIHWARLRIYLRCEDNITNEKIVNYFKKFIFSVDLKKPSPFREGFILQSILI